MNTNWINHLCINKSEIARRLGMKINTFTAKLQERVFIPKNPKQEPLHNKFTSDELIKLDEIRNQICKEMFEDLLKQAYTNGLNRKYI